MNRSWSLSSSEDDEEEDRALERWQRLSELARLAAPSTEDVQEAETLLAAEVPWSADLLHMLLRQSVATPMTELFHNARLERLRLAAGNDVQQSLREAFESDSEDDNFTGFPVQNATRGTPPRIVYTDRINLTRRQHHRHRRRRQEHQP
jgi:hypothetical protein